MHKFLILVILCLIGWFVLTFKITEVPPGINGDEAAIGLSALQVARSGKDLRGEYFPLFSTLPDSLDWKQPITFYSEVIAFKIFKPSYFTLRAVSVFFALFGGVLIFWWLKNLLGNFPAILGFFFLLTTPIIMIQSHLALENIAPIPFIILWLIMITKYEQNPKIRFLSVSALSLIFGFYSYLGMRLIIPILFLITATFILYRNRKKNLQFILRQLLVLVLFAILLFISILVIKNKYPGSLWGLYRPYMVNSYQQFFMPYISNFDPSFLYITGDTTVYHSTGKHGMFLIATLPLFILGIIKIIKINKAVPNIILISFFLAPSLFGLGSTIHRASRIVGLVPMYVAICCFGIVYILSLKRKIFKLLAISGAILLIFVNYLDFTYDYWFEYPKRVQSDFAKPIHLAFEKLYEQSAKNKLTPLIQSDLYLQNPTSFRFFELVFFPDSIKKWSNLTDLPKTSVILVDKGSIKLEEIKNLQIEKVENSQFIILINR